MSLLKIGISSRALFDLAESHEIFKKQGIEEYSNYQKKNRFSSKLFSINVNHHNSQLMVKHQLMNLWLGSQNKIVFQLLKSDKTSAIPSVRGALGTPI